MAEVLKALLGASEKSARIAQLCRQEETLFKLLIEEKTGADKNKKFVQDFKTLADVLIQEVIRHDIGRKFPELQNFIGGEESNKFENGLGETITVQVCATEEATAELLCQVLDQNKAAAEILATAVHQEVIIEDSEVSKVSLTLPLESMGIWIDPIDSTNQYIRGDRNIEAVEGIYPSGLKSALVLIGVYERTTGEPVLGVINEPFYKQDPFTDRWQGRYHWGLSYQGTTSSSLERPGPCIQPSVILSNSENAKIKESLAHLCGRICSAPGAGYKTLCVIQGHVDAYVLSEDTTFKWDSCGPHAILRALGGGIVDLAACQKAWGDRRPGALPELTYHTPVEGARGAQRWANTGGLVAYMHRHRLEAIMGALTNA